MNRFFVSLVSAMILVLASCGNDKDEVTVLNVTQDVASPVWFPDSDSDAVTPPAPTPVETLDSVPSPEEPDSLMSEPRDKDSSQ